MLKNCLTGLLLLSLTAQLSCSDKPDAKTQQGTPSAGEVVFIKNCKVCHAQGINGAPILGNIAMWKDRLPQGEATLVMHAQQGYGLMPAKGGNTDLPDEDIEKAVQYMISKVQ